jgi:Na+/H+-translocating membrane pyrophosphatase
LSAAKGAASEIMHGVSIGYSSVFPLAIVLAIIVFISFEVADAVGIVFASLGVISLTPAYLIVGKLMGTTPNNPI